MNRQKDATTDPRILTLYICTYSLESKYLSCFIKTNIEFKECALLIPQVLDGVLKPLRMILTRYFCTPAISIESERMFKT